MTGAHDRITRLSTRRRWRRVALVGGIAITLAGWAAATRPSNDREWVAEQARVPVARFEGSRVVVSNVRNFDWTVPGDPEPRWEERTYDLDQLESVWYVLTPFADNWRGPAHAFLSFGFADSSYLALSVEARKEVGETYSVLKGMLRRFEIVYVAGDERDLIGLRTHRYGDSVYVYPAKVTRAGARELLVRMLEDANALAAEPAFYGSILNNCTTRILRHVNQIAPEPVRWGWRILLPGYSDALAHRLGLLDTDLPLEAARARFLVNERARAYVHDPAFSTLLR